MLPTRKVGNMQRWRKHLSVCDNKDCSIVCHTFCPPESKMRLLPQFATMSSFQIAHHPEYQNLFYDVHRNGQIYTRSLLNHVMIPKVQSLQECDVPRKCDRSRKRRPNDAEEITQPILPLDEIDGVSIETDQISAVTLPGLQYLSSNQLQIKTQKRKTANKQRAGFICNTRSQITAPRSKTKRSLNYSKSTRNTRRR